MPMTDASKAALAAFFATRRGGKQLQEDIQKGLLAYFVAKTHPGSRVAHVRDGAALLYEPRGVARGYVVPQPVRHRCNACACRMRTARDSLSALLYVGVWCVRGRGPVSCVRTVALARRPPSALAAHAGRGAVARDFAGRGGCRGTRPCETAATARDGVMRCWENPFATGAKHMEHPILTTPTLSTA